jgi:putative flavoprotein involved in K+ transport
MDDNYDVIVIGGGQSGLACGYFLRRTGLNYVILDGQESCGGAWRHGWDSLTLFSPAEHSSLPGWPMPASENGFPTKQEVIAYLCQYEQRYALPIRRPVQVQRVRREDQLFIVETGAGRFTARAVVSATGTWGSPFLPPLPGREEYRGKQVHSAHYREAAPFAGQKVLVVGEGNSGAQVLAEVSKVASTKWATRKPPAFLPDDVDGHVLFNAASAKYRAEKEGKPFDATQYDLGNIVMVPPVKEARSRDVLQASGNLAGLYEQGAIWSDGTQEAFDAIIWCTGFGYSTAHVKALAQVEENGKVKTEETRSLGVPGMWFVGYGGWTGFASATLVGVGRTAKQTVAQVQEYLKR